MRTWVEINADSLRANIDALSRLACVPIWAMVKSNAYGHGAETVVSEMLKSKIYNLKSICGYGFSSGEEALLLRKILPKGRIAVFADSSDASLEELAKNNIEISLTGWDMMEKIKIYRGKQKIKVHIKIETGLNRYGFEIKDISKISSALPALPITAAGIYSHFSAVEEGYYRSAQSQLDAFLWGAHALDPQHIYEWHMAATAAAIELPESRLDSVRLGIGIYGLSPSPRLAKNGSLIDFKPVLTWKTTISDIRHVRVGDTIGYGNTYKVLEPMTIAVLPVGYADGYDRRLSNKGEVLIGGARYPIVGRVFMNTIIVDITKYPDLRGQGGGSKIGDEVVLIGMQGKEEITADEIAKTMGTINYEVVTRINWLIPRIVI